VFIGEYAAKTNTLKAALAEAAYMTGIERNSDIIRMSAYAPLFGNITATHWAPDLIWFNNHQVTGSINYYMQKLFSTNVGTQLLKSELITEKIAMEPFKGMVGVGTWNTTAKFDNIKIVSNETGEVLGEQNFDTDTFASEWQNVADGQFSAVDGELVQSNKTTKAETTGTVAYYGDVNWSNYTYTVEATKISGSEGFLIPFVVQNKDEHYFWNIGGWMNTVSCLQQVSDGNKSQQIQGTSKTCNIKAGRTYKLKVVVEGNTVKCYIDDKLYVDHDFTAVEQQSYQVVSVDDNGDIIIKLVNITGEDRVFAVDIKNAGKIKQEAVVNQVKGDSFNNDNILGAKEDCVLEEFIISGVSNQFNYTVPQYSATVIRIETE
jgi:alpha-L-arabinofuranosidase